MKTFTIAMPVSTMKTALSALEEARRTINAVIEEKAALPALNAVEHGTLAIKKRESDLAALDARKQAATEKAIRVIDNAESSFIEKIDLQTVPAGEDITGANEADFKILEYGLIKAPSALAKIAAKHDAPAFRAMVQMYAEKRDWEGFDFIDKEETIREFGKTFFQQCRSAAKNPSGYYGILYEEEPEKQLREGALSDGLQKEYEKGIAENY